MKWPIVQDVLVRAARILLIALLGAMADAGLLDGQLGAGALRALVVSSSKSWAEPAELLPLPSSLGSRGQRLFALATD